MLKTWLIVALVLFTHINTVHSDDDGLDDEESVLNEKPETETVVTFEPENFETPAPPDTAYFAEFFPQQVLPKNWFISEAKKDDADAKYDGTWVVSTPTEVALNNDYCLIASSKAHHHAISSKLKRPFSFRNSQPFIVQYDVKFQNELECGGAYMKLLSGESVDLKQFNDKTAYTIMFGPDKCGHQAKMHFIVKFRNPKSGEVKEYSAKQPEKSIDSYFTDKKSHLYRLVLNEDGSYEISVDRAKIMSGNLMETMEPSILPEKEIDDPNDVKPDDWDEREKIPDPAATKPAEWDEDAPKKIPDSNAKQPDDWLTDEPEFVSDEKAKKPDDWDEEMDGKWEAPLIKNPKCEKISGCGKWSPPSIDNPNYKGKWKAPLINNPKYQGKWKPRKVENPNYFQLSSAYGSLETIGALGLELWTMTENISFDNFLISDDLLVADDYAAKTWEKKYSAENRRSAKSSIFSTVVQTANDKPWLWAVYLLVVLIPIVLITIFCFGSGKDTKGRAKKMDEPNPDDPAHSENLDEGFPAEEDEGNFVEQKEGAQSKNVSKRSNSSQKSKLGNSKSPAKPTRDDLEGNSDEEDSELSSASNESSKKESGGRSPRRRAARKAD